MTRPPALPPSVAAHPPPPAAGSQPAPSKPAPSPGSRKKNRRRGRGNLHRRRRGPSGALALFLILTSVVTGLLLYLRRPDAADLRDRLGMKDPPIPRSGKRRKEPPAPPRDALAALQAGLKLRQAASSSDGESESAAAPQIPRYRVWLADGQILEGRVLEQTPKYVRFRHDLGPNGYFVQTLLRSEILNMAPTRGVNVPLERSDRRLAQEFRGFHLYKRPPFTIVTDDSFGAVERNVRVLQSLHRQFLTVFDPLIDDSEEDRPIQVVFFRNEAKFRETAARVSPHLARSSGFFDPDHDRLFVYNQIYSEAYANVERQIEAVKKRYGTKGRPADMPASVRTALERTRREIAGAASEATYRTIRHEGAHQLFYHFGIHDRNRLDPTWLMEGLAMYCETPRIGRRNPDRIRTLQENPERIDLKELLAYRGGEAWNRMSDERLLLAYAQSWALVYLLMDKDYRPGFFAYLAALRDSELLDPPEETDDPVADLARAVGVPAQELRKAYDELLASF